MNTPARQNADRLTLRTAPPRSSTSLRKRAGAVGLLMMAQVAAGMVGYTHAVWPFVGILLLSWVAGSSQGPFWLMRLAFHARGCAVVTQVDLERCSDGNAYRAQKCVLVSYGGQRARLVSAGWDTAGRYANDGSTFDVLWLVVETEDAERELVLLPAAESVRVQALLRDVDAFAGAGGAHGVVIADKPWGLWSTASYLSNVYDGALGNVRGVSRREAKLQSVLSWGEGERALFARVSAARRLRVWVGHWAGVMGLLLGIFGPLVAIEPSIMELAGASADGICPPACALTLDVAYALTLVSSLVAVWTVVRAASHLARRRWIDASLADWELLGLDDAEIRAISQAELNGRRAATRWRRVPRRTKSAA